MRKKKQTKKEDLNKRASKSRVLDLPRSQKSDDEVWERLLKIREELAKGWQIEESAVEILSEMRR